MDAVEAMTRTVNASRRWFEGTIGGLTPEQVNFVPAGSAHPIGETVVHILNSEDGIVNGMLRGQPAIWERDGWGAKLGLPNVMRQDEAVARAFRCDLPSLQPYMQAVHASVDEYLKGLTAADLDREIDGPGGKMTVTDALGILVMNTLSHAGEIAAIKGIQGGKGYPF